MVFVMSHGYIVIPIMWCKLFVFLVHLVLFYVDVVISFVLELGFAVVGLVLLGSTLGVYLVV